MKYLLIVDDDSDLREGLAAVLSDSALAAYTAADIASARRMLDATAFDLVLLDCNLPDGSGIDFCHELTSARDIAVVFLTIRDSELDEVTALRAGACDYLRKPFSLSVLRERINAALRRGLGFCMYEDALYRFDFAAHSYAAGSRPVSLSATEQKLLALFCQNKGRLLDRATLNERIWQSDEYIDDGALSVAVRRLRQKLGSDCIRTVYGLGYIWRGAAK